MSSLLKKLLNFLQNQNIIRTKEKMFSSNMLKGVVLKGNISIGKNNILKFVEVHGNITLGNNNTLNGPNLILASQINSISIGNFCSIARDVTIQEYNHPTDRISTYYLGKNIFKHGHKDEIVSKGSIDVGSDVWIGTKAMILSGVSIGHGAIVAGGSVVTKDVPAFAIVGGNPAKVIKYRFSETVINKLLMLEWWNWPIEKINKNKNLFTKTLTLEMLDEIEEDE